MLLFVCALAIVLGLPRAVFASGEFITTWQTTSTGQSITIPTTGGGYDYTVDWGDASSTSGITGNATHTYAATGTHTVMISGAFPRIYFNNTVDKTKILSVEQWGTNAWTSMERAFYGANNLVVNATDTPDLSGVTSMAFMFAGATTFNQNIDSWDVSHVVSMDNLFFNARNFNQPLNDWNTTSVTSMASMFVNARAFNQPIDAWNVSHVYNMNNLFMNAVAFNQDINDWDVSHVGIFMNTFMGATAFNQPLDHWNVSHASYFYSMFKNATAFNRPLEAWDMSSAINLEWMFSGATSFNQPLNGWNLASLATLDRTFQGATAFNQSLDHWNVSQVVDMTGTFQGATAFNQDIHNWDVSHVTDMAAAFSGASAFNQPLDDWDVSHVESMSNMFADAIRFNQSLDRWNVSNVTDIGGMFYDASSFNQPLNTWNVSQVTTMVGLFQNASAFNQPLNTWDVSHVTDMSNVFQGASMFNQDLGNWHVAGVTSMYDMFTDATAFNQSLASWDVSHVTDMTDMFLDDTLSTSNYDALLTAWSELSLQSGVPFNAGNSQYSAATTARDTIIDTYGWTIGDEGLLPPAPAQSHVTSGGGVVALNVVQPTALMESGRADAPFSVRVNGSVAPVVTTSQEIVQLSFNADPSRVRGYAISLRPDFLLAGIYPYVSTTTYTLPATPGDYTVYVKFYSTTGNPSDAISRSISYVPPEITTPPREISTGAPPGVILFHKSFGKGARSEDVRRLQLFLNAHGYVVATQGEGSSGKETTLFGEKTRTALMKYQKKMNMTPATGFFGPATMKYINGLIVHKAQQTHGG